MSREKREKVEAQTEGQSVLADPVILRQQALIELLRSFGYRSSDMERMIGVGRLKPSRNGTETTGERVTHYYNGKYHMAPVRQAALCAGVFVDGKVPGFEDDFKHWQLSPALQQAKLPLLLLRQVLGDHQTDRAEARRLVLGLQRKLEQRRRSEKDQLVTCARVLAERLSELLGLLVSESRWTSSHALFAIKPWGDNVQLDLSGTGTTFFTYRWDQPGANPFDHPQERPQPLVYTQDEESPKDRFQCLLAHLDECLRAIVVDEVAQGSITAREILKHAKSTRRAIAALFRRMNAPRLVSWYVLHPVCVLDDHWWKARPNLSPVAIRHRLANGQEWCPLPDDLIAQPILFGTEHNTPEKRCLRFLELIRDATRTVRPDMMIDIGADIIGMDAWKSLNLIARHGWI